MALKVVPAGDERCDIHNQRPSPSFICEDCLKQSGVKPARHVTSRRRRVRRLRPRRILRRLRSGPDRKTLIGAGIAVVLALGVYGVAGLVGGGSEDEGEGNAASEADVVNALDLLPNPSGSGWITSDGACAVVSIDLSEVALPGESGNQLSIEATNEARTIAAVVLQNDFSISQADCVERVDAALKAEF